MEPPLRCMGRSKNIRGLSHGFVPVETAVQDQDMRVLQRLLRRLNRARVFHLGNECLCVQRSHTAHACRGDRLPVNMVC